MNENNENTHAQYKPGIKLPKTSSDWAMANANFQSILDISTIPTSVITSLRKLRIRSMITSEVPMDLLKMMMPRMIIFQSITQNQLNLSNPLLSNLNHPKLNSKKSDLLVN